MSMKICHSNPSSAAHREAAAHARASVLIPRFILGTIISTAVLLPSLYDPLISTLYAFLCDSTFYNFSVFETIEILLFYAVIEPLYTVKFIRNPSLRTDIRRPKSRSSESDAIYRKRPRMRRPSRRLLEIASSIAPQILLDLILVKKFAGVSLADITRSGGYEPIETNDGHVSSSFLLPTMHNFSLSSPLQLRRALPANAPSSRRIVLELIISFFIYDTLFFFIHIAFHRVPVLRRIHRPHHRHGEMNPQVTNRLSVVERVSLILLANFSLNIIRSHVLTRTAFVPVFVYLLVEVHCGLDLEWGYDKVLPCGWGAGSKKHAVHHREGEGSYQPFFCWWDDAWESLEKNFGGNHGIDSS